MSIRTTSGQVSRTTAMACSPSAASPTTSRSSAELTRTENPFGLALAIAVPTFASRGVHQLGVDVPQLWLGAALASACFALLGVALGAVTRNTVGAIVAALVWAQLIEVTILQNLIPSLAKWLPTGAAVALTTVGDNAKLLSPYAAAAALAGWTAVLCLVAAVISMRREVK